MVATSHPAATAVGLAVLKSGGSAADAFVAAALAEDVVLPGVTSTAGLAGVIVYEAKSQSISYLHGGLADPIDPERRLPPALSVTTAPGRLVLVPGAPAAYAELVARFSAR